MVMLDSYSACFPDLLSLQYSAPGGGAVVRRRAVHET